MYMPLISPAPMACMISTTVRPGCGARAPARPRPRKCARTAAVADALVVGQHHRDQAGVGRALHVVLPAQRMQPGAGAADLAGHQRQRDQAARVVGAVHMLADAHAPQDHRRPAPAYSRATSRIVAAGMPQMGAIASGVGAHVLAPASA
jgi:hypothetical protein